MRCVELHVSFCDLNLDQGLPEMWIFLKTLKRIIGVWFHELDYQEYMYVCVYIYRALLIKLIDVSCGHMTCQNINFHHKHEEEQNINFVLVLIDLANLDDKWEPSWHLTYWLWSFNTSVWKI